MYLVAFSIKEPNNLLINLLVPGLNEPKLSNAIGAYIKSYLIQIIQIHNDSAIEQTIFDESLTYDGAK